MTTKKCIDREARRLLRLPFAPNDADGIESVMREFTRVLQAHCTSDSHCTAVVTHVMDRTQRMPPPSEIVNAAYEVADPEVSKGPDGCEACGETGFRSVERRTPLGYTVDVAVFCECSKGQWMLKAEKERIAEKAAKEAKRA